MESTGNPGGRPFPLDGKTPRCQSVRKDSAALFFSIALRPADQVNTVQVLVIVMRPTMIALIMPAR